jgi:hypothetical protein
MAGPLHGFRKAVQSFLDLWGWLLLEFQDFTQLHEHIIAYISSVTMLIAQHQVGID